MKIKTTMKYHYALIIMIEIKKIVRTPNAGKDGKKLDHLHIAGKNVK